MVNKAMTLIIKDDKVLMVEGISQHGRIDGFFISGEGNTWDQLKADINKQLNLNIDKVLEVRKKVGNGISLYVVNLAGVEDEKINLEDNIENIKCLRNDYKAIEVKWVDLNNIKAFNEFNALCLKEAFKESIKADSKGKWLDIVKANYYSSPLGLNQLKDIYSEKERTEVDAKESIKSKLTAMILALSMGILFNYFFVWKSIGVSAIIYIGIFILAAMYILGGLVSYKNKLSLLFLIPIILLSISFSIYNDGVLRSLNIIVIPFLVVGYLLIVRYKSINIINIGFIASIFDRVFNQALRMIPKSYIFTSQALEKRKGAKVNPIQRSIILGIIISIPLLVLVIILLSSADMMFKYHLESIGRIFDGFRIDNLIGDSVIIAVASLYIFGFLWSFKYNQISKNDNSYNSFKATWEPITIITIVFIINIAYLLFTIVQFSYLYGGGGLPEGFSYAEYARKGFFELILVTVINLIILLLSINLTKKSSLKIDRILKTSNSLLIAFTFNMLVSANYKMYLYEKAYGFTRLRIYVRSFMLLIGIILIITLIGIWIRRTPVLKYALIATLVVYVGLNFINVDRIIARENIERYMETNKLDIHYLSTLSYDAAPEIQRLLKVEDKNIRREAYTILKYKKEDLKESYNHWFQLNYYKSRMLRVKLD